VKAGRGITFYSSLFFGDLYFNDLRLSKEGSGGKEGEGASGSLGNYTKNSILSQLELIF